MTGDGRVKLGDFGLAAALSEADDADEGLTVGTPSYMAPELAMARELSPATDLYAVGCVAFELLAGRQLFGSDTGPMEVLLRQVNEPAPELVAVVAGTDPELSAWVGWLLEKDPLARPASAMAAWEVLEDILLRLLGPRWRREARLTTPAAAEAPTVLTPAPFEAFDTGAMAPAMSPPDEGGYDTFGGGISTALSAGTRPSLCRRPRRTTRATTPSAGACRRCPSLKCFRRARLRHRHWNRSRPRARLHRSSRHRLPSTLISRRCPNRCLVGVVAGGVRSPALRRPEAGRRKAGRTEAASGARRDRNAVAALTAHRRAVAAVGW